jgi:hypothetical protein
VMIRFHAHADECSRVETEALALVSAIARPKEATDSTEETEEENDPLRPYNSILQRLGASPLLHLYISRPTTEA